MSPSFPYEFVRLADGTKVRPPENWALLKPGDAALTKRVKAAGPSWTVQTKKGRKTFSKGVWAHAATIEAERAKLNNERATPEHARKLARARTARDRVQADYVAAFEAAVLAFLAFAPPHDQLGRDLARAVAAQATPVGSGTVARTERIPIARRAESAVIAWMRHHTTAYDHLSIDRVKGQRRSVRAALNRESRALLSVYRAGEPAPRPCPLAVALRMVTPERTEATP